MFFKQLFYLLSYFFCFILFSQNDLTLNDAVLKRWTDFYPENLSNLEWQKSQDFYSYKKNNCLLIFNEKNNLIDEVCIGELNIDDLTEFPDIKWVTNHSFKFEYKNQIYLFNTKRGRKPVLYLDYDIKAANKDYNFKRNLLAYTIENDLFISSIDTNLQVNKFEKDIVFGKPVHRYEFGIYKGTFWSPNGNKLAFYKNSQKKVDTYPLLISSDTTSKIKHIKYPMAGDSSEYVEVGIFDVNKNKTIYLETYSESDYYLTNICWGPSEKYIYVAVLNRDQNHLKLNKYDANSGLFLKTLIEEKDDKYVHPLHPIIFLDNEKFLWRSEKDGFDQLYLYNKKGKLIKKVTNGDLAVKEYLGFKNNIIYFSAFSEDGLDVHLYSFSLDEKNKKAQKKISSKFPGFHKFKMSPSGNLFIDEFSNLKLPRIIQIINSEGDEVHKLLESKNPLNEYKIGLTELVKIPTDNNIFLNSRIIKPYDFDPSKKYPVLIYVYNGPHVQLINNRWLGGLLTNFNTIRKSIAKLEDLRNKLKNQKIYNLSKKQIIDLKRDIDRLEKNLLGVQNLTKLPDAIFVIDTRYERIAIQEANKLNIPVIALVDSNNSFEGVDYMIPANDDAMSSIDLFLKSISEIILESKPKKSSQAADTGADQKKSIKAKKVVKAPEQKKVLKNPKKTTDNKEEQSE